MREADWLSETNVPRMIRWASGEPPRANRPEWFRPSPRKLRLWAVAACRSLWRWLDEAGRRAIGVAERLADGEATDTERHLAWCMIGPDARHPARNLCAHTPRYDSLAVEMQGARGDFRADEAASAALLRCVAGNPFRYASLAGTSDAMLAPARRMARIAYDHRPEAECDNCKGRGEFWHHGYAGPRTTLLRCDICPPLQGPPHFGHRGSGRVVADGHLDPLALLAVADALEEAGREAREACGHCKECEPLWECERCQRIGAESEWTLHEGRPVCASCWLADYRGPLVPFRHGSIHPRCTFCDGKGWMPDALLSHLRSPEPHVRGCWAVDLVLGLQ